MEQTPIHYQTAHRRGFVRIIIHAVGGDCEIILTSEEAEQFADDILDSANKIKLGDVQ